MNNLFKKDKRARKIKAMVKNLPLLPKHLTKEGYDIIQNLARNNMARKFSDLLGYFQRYWLNYQVYLSFLISYTSFRPTNRPPARPPIRVRIFHPGTKVTDSLVYYHT